jgi:hypothetical protein
MDKGKQTADVVAGPAEYVGFPAIIRSFEDLQSLAGKGLKLKEDLSLGRHVLEKGTSILFENVDGISSFYTARVLILREDGEVIKQESIRINSDDIEGSFPFDVEFIDSSSFQRSSGGIDVKLIKAASDATMCDLRESLASRSKASASTPVSAKVEEAPDSMIKISSLDELRERLGDKLILQDTLRLIRSHPKTGGLTFNPGAKIQFQSIGQDFVKMLVLEDVTEPSWRTFSVSVGEMERAFPLDVELAPSSLEAVSAVMGVPAEKSGGVWTKRGWKGRKII